MMEPQEADVRHALDSILASTTFADAKRLKSFLQYIVEETLNGRDTNVRAKIIAFDVYGRRPEDGVEQEAIVRVDAGRLRRRLEVYYSDEGAKDSWRIQVPSGGYTPEFVSTGLSETVESVQNENIQGTNRKVLYATALAICLLCIGIGWVLGSSAGDPNLSTEQDSELGISTKERLTRTSVNEVSSSSMLAITFAKEARDLIFPSIDHARLQAAEILCQRSIELAPELSIGHACDAFAQGFIAFLMPMGDTRNARLSHAQQEATLALRNNPTDPYAQMADAWVSFVGGQRKVAIEQAKSTIRIAPQESFLLNFYGMMMGFDGQGSKLLSDRFPNANIESPEMLYHPFIVAAVKLQVEDYTGSIQALEEAIQIEGRTSALMTGIYISALENSGNRRAAEKFARNLKESWRVVQFNETLENLYSNSSDVLAIVEPVQRALDRVDSE